MSEGNTRKPSAKPPFFAFVRDAADQEALRRFAHAHDWDDSSVLEGDISTASEFLGNHTSPVLLVVEIPSAEQAPALLDALANVCDPGTKVAIVGNINEYSFFCWLQEIGVFHYLLRPLNVEALESMYQKLAVPQAADGATEKEPGKVVALIGTRGGSGTTSIALLLAALIAEKTEKHVALVDADPQDGSASLLLDLEPSRGFKEAIEKPDRIDNFFLERTMVKASERLHILSGEENINEQVEYNEEAADQLIEMLREKYHLIVFDLPHTLNPFVRKTIRLADSVMVVSEQSLQGLRDAMRINEWLKEKLKIAEPVFIANKVGLEKKHEVDKEDFEKSLNAKINYQIPFSPEIFMEIANDLAVLKKTDEDGYKVLYDICKFIDPTMVSEEEEAGKGKKKGRRSLKKK